MASKQQAFINPTNHHQTGAALLLMVAAIAILSSFALYHWATQEKQTSEKEQQTQILSRMLEAKERLFVFSENIPTIYAGTGTKLSPGFFLCPDMDAPNSDSAGSSNGSCSWNTNNAIGRLPTNKTTANGQYFFFSVRASHGGDGWWYMIHNSLRLGSGSSASFYYINQNPVYDVMPNTLTLDGEPIVAALIEAGSPLSQQTGRDLNMGTKTQWTQFLESVIPDYDGAKLTQLIQDKTKCNDTIIPITKAEFDQRIKQQVCRLATENHWCQTYNSLSNTHWFKQFQWGYSGANARVCQLDNHGVPNDINPIECMQTF